MKTALVLFASVGLAVAQDLSGQPACATNCLISAISAAGCSPSDIACQCGPSQSAIVASAVPCLLQACQASELGQAQAAGEARCAAFSATIGMPAATSGGGVTLTANPIATSSQISLSGSINGPSSTAPAPTASVPTMTLAPGGGSSASSSPSSTQSSTIVTNAAAVPTGVGAGLVVALLGAMAAL